MILDFQGGSAAGQFTSAADQALTLNYNPAFFVGAGSQNNAPTGNPASTSSQTVTPNLSQSQTQAETPTPSYGYGTVSPSLGLSSLSPTTMIIMLVALGLILVMPSGGKH